MTNEIENKTTEVKETSAKTKKQYSSEDIKAVLNTPEAQEMMKSMVAEMIKVQQSTPQVFYQKEEMVTLLYMGAVAEGSIVKLWDGCEIQGRGGMLDVPKKEFMQKMAQNIIKRLRDRRLIVVEGFTDDERERFGVKYTDGELASATIYYKLLSYDDDKILSIFKSVCPSHKAIIASLFKTAYMAHNNRINQPLIEKLNKLSKEVEPKGMFGDILKDMAKALSEGSDEE